MSQWQEQIVSNYNAIQQIISNAKNINELDDIVSELNDSSLIAIYQSASTPKATLGELKEFVLKSLRPFVFAENCLIEKDASNTNYTAIEVNDYVYFKRVTDGASTITLVGHTYTNALADNDKDNYANYTQNQIIEI